MMGGDVSAVYICHCGRNLETVKACVSKQSNYEEIKLFVAAAFSNTCDIKLKAHFATVEYTFRQDKQK